MTNDVAKYSARNGNLNILIWAYKNNLPWKKTVCKYAEEGGYINVIRWIKNGRCKCQGKYH